MGDSTNIADITVIGGGPGGYAAAITGARLGARVTLIEKKKLGGTCLNEGCIPTKALLKCADIYATCRKAEVYGLELGQASFNLQKAMAFKNQAVEQLTGGVGHLVRANKIDFIQGEGRILDPHTVAVTGHPGVRAVKTQNIIIATGSGHVELPGLEADGISILNSSQMLEYQELPRKLAIIGGGVIGVEFASIFSRLGVQVSIIELTPRLIPTEEEEVSLALRQALTKNGVDIHLEARARGLKTRGPGDLLLQVELKDGTVLDVECSQVLVCVGRKALIQEVGALEAGVRVEQGRIVTDKQMKTDVEGIYAIGDVTGSEQLAHVAYYEARTAVQNIMGTPAEANYLAMPHCIYAAPEVATVGYTEQAARERYARVKTAKFPFYGNGKALIEGATEGFVKLVSDGDGGRILGAAIIGPKATELIAEYTLAVNLGLKVKDIVNTVHAHPTLSEALHEAGLAALGLNLHSI